MCQLFYSSTLPINFHGYALRVQQEEEEAERFSFTQEQKEELRRSFIRRHMITNRFRRVTSDGQVIALNYNNNNRRRV